MQDNEIVALFWARSQDAVPAAEAAYGGYCSTIAQNILGSPEDAEECVNDTWLNAWNAMPPQRPRALAAFLGRITRNLAFNRWKYERAARRGGGELPLVLDELAQCVSGGETAEDALNRKALTEAIHGFLTGLPARNRSIFLCRYWYADSVSAIAAQFSMTPSHVSMTLTRLRRQLRDHLTKGGFEL